MLSCTILGSVSRGRNDKVSAYSHIVPRAADPLKGIIGWGTDSCSCRPKGFVYALRYILYTINQQKQ